VPLGDELKELQKDEFLTGVKLSENYDGILA
jgi:hypothetical protein